MIKPAKIMDRSMSTYQVNSSASNVEQCHFLPSNKNSVTPQRQDSKFSLHNLFSDLIQLNQSTVAFTSSINRSQNSPFHPSKPACHFPFAGCGRLIPPWCLLPWLPSPTTTTSFNEPPDGPMDLSQTRTAQRTSAALPFISSTAMENNLRLSKPPINGATVMVNSWETECRNSSQPNSGVSPNKFKHASIPTTPGKQPITRCNQCKQLFKSLTELNNHFMLQHAAVLLGELEQTKSWKSHAVEEMCFQELEVVIKRGDVETVGYPCPHCSYFAKWPTELQKHIMVHSRERPHQCVICGLSYKWKWDLGRHFDKSHQQAANPYKKSYFGTGGQNHRNTAAAEQRLSRRPSRRGRSTRHLCRVMHHLQASSTGPGVNSHTWKFNPDKVCHVNPIGETEREKLLPHVLMKDYKNTSFISLLQHCLPKELELSSKRSIQGSWTCSDTKS